MKRLNHQVVRDVMGTAALAAGGLAEGTNAGTIKTVNTVNYVIDNQFYSKSATDNVDPTNSDHSVQDASKTAMYLVSLDASGNFKVTQGDIVASGEDAYLPDVPADECPIGAFKITTDSSTTYDCGTTDIGASGITETFYDLMRAHAGAF